MIPKFPTMRMLGIWLRTWCSNFTTIQRWMNPRSWFFWDRFGALREKKGCLRSYTWFYMVSILYKQPWLLVLSSIAYIYINLRINYCRHVQGCGMRLQVEPHPVHASNVVKKDILPGSAQVLSRCISEYLLNIVSKIIMVVCLFFPLTCFLHLLVP